jgi:hypothetical protein
MPLHQLMSFLVIVEGFAQAMNYLVVVERFV